MAARNMTRRFTLASEVPDTEKKKALKVVFFGESGVGKLTMISRVIKDWYASASTVIKKSKKSKKGEKSTADLGIRGRDLNVEVFDTSSINSKFALGLPTCDVFVLVYSLVSSKSFRSVCAVKDKIVQKKGADFPVVFVGNKTDIADSVDKMERSERDITIRDDWRYGHLEISAEQDVSVKQVLEQIMGRFHGAVSAPEKELLPSGKSRAKRIKKFFSRSSSP